MVIQKTISLLRSANGLVMVLMKSELAIRANLKVGFSRVVGAIKQVVVGDVVDGDADGNNVGEFVDIA